MRITIIIHSLTSGGAERTASMMANYWARKDWSITLLTLDDDREPPFYELHSKIVYRPLGVASDSLTLHEKFLNNARRITALRSAIRDSRPNAIISFMDQTNILTVVSIIGLHLPVFLSQQIDPQYYALGKVWKMLRAYFYSRATRVVVQTERTLRYFSPRIQKRSRVIPSPVLLPDANVPALELRNHCERKVIIAMGRLDPQKGFDMLIEAFGQVASIYPQWSLEIWGEGHIRSDLEVFRDTLGLRDRVRLPGRTKDPFKQMRQADLFVLASRYEGFPNVLLEAMSCGLPVISFDCPTGPREIIRHGVNGLLVQAEDVFALAASMDRLMGDDTERQLLAVRAPEVLERFGLENIMGIWEAMIQEVLE